MRGSIRQRGETFTCYWFTHDAATGKRKQHTRGGFTRKEPARPPKGDSAREYLNSIVGPVQEGSWRPEKALTVKELLEDHWLPAQRARELRPATLEQYGYVIDGWLVPNIGGVRVQAITPKVVTQLDEKLRTTKTANGRKGLSARSRQLAVGTLKSACKWAVENDLLGRNPVSGVRRPSVKGSKAMNAWTVDEARAFLAATRDDRLAPAWALLLTRGLRRGELCGLRWSEVDLGAKVLRIVSTLVVVDGKAITSEPKTEAGKRSIPIDDSLVALLRRHQMRQAEEKLASGGAYEAGGYVVADELGRPYHPDTISQWFADKVKAADLRVIRLHDCRHTAASLMLAAGEQVKVVSEMLGHSSVTITLNLYAHVMPGMAEKAGAALSASLLGGGE